MFEEPPIRPIGRIGDGIATVPVAPQFPVRFLGRADGLPSGQVHATTTDDRGRLWMATPNGLARYDGSRVVTIDRRDGLTTHGLRSVATDTDGIWVGHDVGLDRVRFDGTVEPMVNGWRWGLANDITLDPDGVVWVASADGLLRSTSDGGWVQQNDPRLCGSAVHRCATDRAGRVWASSRHRGIFVRYEGDVWEPPADDAWQRVGTVQCIRGASDGSMLIGGSDGVVNIDLTGAVVREIEPVDAPVYAVFATRSELWIGAGTDLHCYRPGAHGWHRYATVATRVHVNHLASDRHGNVWAATDTSGVMKIEAVRSAIARPDLPTGSVFAIRSTASGQLLIAGDESSGVYDRAGSETFGEIDSLRGMRVWDLMEDSRGQVWAATESGLLAVDAHHAQRFGGEHPVLSSPARALLEHGGELFVGTLVGLARIAADREAVPVDDDRHHALGYVYTLTARGADLWIGTLGNGLWKHDGSSVRQVVGEGLSTIGNTYAIAVRDDGSVVVTQDDRIVIVGTDDTSRVLATSPEALAGWSVAIDRDGRLWIGSSSGLCEYDTTTGDLLRRVTLWTGVEGSEFTTSRSLFVDCHGNLLCGLNSGLAMIDSARLVELTGDRPNVGLASASWFGVSASQTSDAAWSVPTGRWTFEARVYSTWPFFETTRLFRYRLDGFHDDWTEPTAGSQIQFTSLPHGEYLLHAQAHSPLAGWGPAAQVAAISVQRRSLARRRRRGADRAG
jgi:ligand-binding sensor domain-containing protein